MPPLSSFRVAAVARGLSGRVYVGFNLELPGLGLQHTVHAEQAAVALAHAGGEQGLEVVAVSAPPCGFCRQFLRELQTRTPLSIVFADGARYPLGELLPHSFGPEDLGQQTGMLERQRPLPQGQVGMELARVAALGSWAPYTESLAGVALRCGERWFWGSYLENAAFNPSLNPMQYALVQARHAGFEYADVAEVYLWEQPSRISLIPATQAVVGVLPGRPALFTNGTEGGVGESGPVSFGVDHT